MAQPQEHRVWAASVTYTTAHSNVGPLTHWARTGIDPKYSWILVRFITAEPQWECLFFETFFLEWMCLHPVPIRLLASRPAAQTIYWGSWDFIHRHSQNSIYLSLLYWLQYVFVNALLHLSLEICFWYTIQSGNSTFIMISTASFLNLIYRKLKC